MKSVAFFTVFLCSFVSSVCASEKYLLIHEPRNDFEKYIRAIQPVIIDNDDYARMVSGLKRMRRSTKWNFGVLGLDAVDTSANLRW